MTTEAPAAPAAPTDAERALNVGKKMKLSSRLVGNAKRLDRSSSLFHCDRLSQISWMINIRALHNCDMIRQQL